MLAVNDADEEPEQRQGDSLLRRNLLKKREERRQEWKRDLSGRANGTIDPFYGCFLLEEVMDYAQNFSFPWSEFHC